MDDIYIVFTTRDFDQQKHTRGLLCAYCQCLDELLSTLVPAHPPELQVSYYQRGVQLFGPVLYV